MADIFYKNFYKRCFFLANTIIEDKCTNTKANIAIDLCIYCINTDESEKNMIEADGVTAITIIRWDGYITTKVIATKEIIWWRKNLIGPTITLKWRSWWFSMWKGFNWLLHHLHPIVLSRPQIRLQLESPKAIHRQDIDQLIEILILMEKWCEGGPCETTGFLVNL